MMKKSVFFLILIFTLISFSTVQAKTYRISISQFVEHPALGAILKGFQDSIRDQGLKVDYRVHNAQGNMGTAGQIAQQMLGENPDLILAITTPTAQASAQVLKKAPPHMRVPLLFSGVTDPKSAGLVRSWERPGKNITGVSDMLPIAKHLDMLEEFLPKLKKLGLIYNSGEANSKILVKVIKKEASQRGFRIVPVTVSKSSEVYQAAKSLVGRVDAVYITTDSTVISALESAIKVGIRNKLPIFASDVDSVSRGAVAAMGFDYYKHGYQTGVMAKKILEGANPATTPVETQKELQLHINQTYAAKMGVTIPKSLLAKANKLIK
ncbi:MAG: ABC transporter permease [SAR324 cluster bacterium]|uniref:ABC transporter permease n=1 Tax=SAR324 cluster bacterium TaxID=2024889 RepID=A0A2A4T9Y9_9DELT|nr:MAG: ABC transporter permease [SAR324 cluster bacterium]